MARSQSSGLACSFCGKSKAEVRKLISGPTVYICDECVGLCVEIIEPDDAEAPALAELKRMSLLDFLRQFASGRAVDSITVSELRDAIAAERDHRLPKPPSPPHDDSQPTNPELERLATRYGVPAIDLATHEIDPEAIKLISEEVARRYRALPVSLLRPPAAPGMIVAMADPTQENITRFLVSIPPFKQCGFVVAKEADLHAAIERYYPHPH